MELSRRFKILRCKDYKELYADPTKHFTDEELKERDAKIKPGEEASKASEACKTRGRGSVVPFRPHDQCLLWPGCRSALG